MWVLLVLVMSGSNTTADPGKMEITFQSKEHCLSVTESLENSLRSHKYTIVKRCERASK